MSYENEKGGASIIKLFKKRESIQFSGRKHTKLGILSAVIGLMAVLGFITLSIISGIYGGGGGLLIGIAGICLFFIALLGFILSYKELKQRDIYYKFPMIGIITNGIMLILLMIIYILGIEM